MKINIRRLIDILQEYIELITHVPLLLSMHQNKKKGKTVVCYQILSAGQLQYILPIHNVLLNKHSERFSFYVSMDYPMQDKLTELDLPEEKFFPSKIAKYLTNIDIFLEPEIHSRGPKQAIKIFSGHGQANKLSNWADENLRAFDIYFLHGPLEREMFEVVKASRPEATKHIELVDIGYPKLDALINGTYDRSAILKKLSFEPKNKTIIYAPAWDPGGSLRTYGIKVIQTLLSIPNVNILVKLHPASMEPKNSPHYEFYTGGIDWEEEFSHFNDNSRFKFIKDYLINPYLHVSDLMVNDFSGVGLEFMVLNRPVIYIDCPEYFEKVLPSWNCDANLAKNDDRFNGGRNAGTVVYNLDMLKQAVIFELSEPNINSSKREALSQKLMFNPGRGANVAADDIINRISNKDYYSK